MKKNKGITLIALIITIIILLILVGVSLNLVIKGDLFGSAEKAVEGTNAKVEEQQTRVDELMGKLDEVNEKNTKHNWQYTDSTREKIRCTCARCKIFPDGDSTGRTLNIGQQIGETEYKTASTSITAEKSGDSDQTLKLEEEETKWVVFGYEDKDKDGLNEVLLLTTEYPTRNTIYFYGAAAYNNGVDEVNRMCRELYGSNARGITIEDVNKALGYEPDGGIYYLNGNYNKTDNLTTKLKDLGDMWTAIVNFNTNSKSGVFFDPTNPRGISDKGYTLGEYELNGYFYKVDDIPPNTAYTAKAMVFGNSYRFGYWLASRGVYVAYNYASFGPGYVGNKCVYSYDGLFNSDDYSRGLVNSPLRPIVSLTAEIPVGGEILEFSSGSSENEPQ